jgi:hypothetical protein
MWLCAMTAGGQQNLLRDGPCAGTKGYRAPEVCVPSLGLHLLRLENSSTIHQEWTKAWLSTFSLLINGSAKSADKF